MIGLREESPVFLLKFLLVLAMFNVTSASVCVILLCVFYISLKVCLAISIVFEDSSVASLMVYISQGFNISQGYSSHAL